MFPQHRLLEATHQVGAEPLQRSTSHSQLSKSLQKDTMSMVSKAAERSRRIYRVTLPLSLSRHRLSIIQGDQGCFCAKTGPEPRLKWIQIISLLQECLELVCNHALQDLAQEWDICYRPVVRFSRSKEDLFRSGLTTASLRWPGSTPSGREALITSLAHPAVPFLLAFISQGGKDPVWRRLRTCPGILSPPLSCTN